MDKTITGLLLQKADDMFDNSLDEKGWFSYVKSFFSGVILGVVDSCFVAGIFYVIANVITNFKKGRK